MFLIGGLKEHGRANHKNVPIWGVNIPNEMFNSLESVLSILANFRWHYDVLILLKVSWKRSNHNRNSFWAPQNPKHHCFQIPYLDNIVHFISLCVSKSFIKPIKQYVMLVELGSLRQQIDRNLHLVKPIIKKSIQCKSCSSWFLSLH